MYIYIKSSDSSDGPIIAQRNPIYILKYAVKRIYVYAYV